MNKTGGHRPLPLRRRRPAGHQHAAGRQPAGVRARCAGADRGLKRHRIQTGWLRWLLPSQTVVQDVTGSVAGVTGYTYGNGVQARLVRGPNGMLAQVQDRLVVAATGVQGAAALKDARGVHWWICKNTAPGSKPKA